MEKLQKLLTEATARPWKIHKYDITEYGISGRQKYDANFGERVAKVCFHDGMEANARLITLAANYFEAVVEALEPLIAHVEDHKQGKIWNIDFIGITEALDNARTVLAAIEKDASHDQ